ncbi:hypothetical protein DEI91_05375 [Curtobacterium sp. MCBD17_032]|nr:hypothetical protein DEI91_05375 [Curtobacterium sp. MCBD17_032]
MQPRRRPLTLDALVMTVLLTGCAAGAAQQTKDAAGLTQDDVAVLTLHGQIQYSLDVDGRYSLDVSSEPFWTNDSDALSAAVSGRATLDWPTESRPGEYPTPPTWDDPVVNHPKI